MKCNALKSINCYKQKNSKFAQKTESFNDNRLQINNWHQKNAANKGGFDVLTRSYNQI